MPITAIRSNYVITPGGETKATIIIEDGRFKEIVEGENQIEGSADFGDLVIMPGIIDPHVHINEPGRTEWEGFETATKAAIAGGITAMVDMPLNSSPVTTSVRAFEEKLGAARRNAHTNLGFWGGVIPGNQTQLEPLIEKGVLGFKAFLVDSGIDEFPNVTEQDLRKAMPIIAKHGLPLLVHCELADKQDLISDRRSYKEYLYSRPVSWEDNAIAMMIRLCEEFNCRTHIVHLSSANSIKQIEDARQRGIPLTVESSQHYLFFNAEEIKDGNTLLKCAPPIREKANNEKLWTGLKDGIIDFVATDHSPAPKELKHISDGDFTKAWGGIASIQFALPALWTSAKLHKCTITQIAKWLCANPAKLAGIQSRKGKIEKGYDADLVIWDPNESFLVTMEMVEFKHKISPYIGQKLFGTVHQTYLAGEKVFERGKFLHLNRGKMLSGRANN